MADENPIETMTPGQILADVNVSEYIKSMGLAIAEAQQALDANSLSQFDAYALRRTTLENKSLLELGLSPPFYHYQHADLSVSMQLTMKVGEASAFGIGGKLDLGFGNGGAKSPADAREAQITLKSLPASVTVDGAKSEAAGADLEAAAEDLAKRLRAPPGKFELALASSTRSAVIFALEPTSAQNPIKTDTAVVFYPTAASSVGVIRIVETPAKDEAFKLANGKTATVKPAANKLLFARDVVTEINKLGGFKARLAFDPVDTTLPRGGGTLGLALFDTGSDHLKPDATAELSKLARMLKDGVQTVDVIGYADPVGSKEANTKLGQKRADAVADFLGKNGVPKSRIRTVTSRGEERWITGQTGDPNGPANLQFRRVEVQLADSTDLLIIVDSAETQLLPKPEPDKTADAVGNGFIAVREFSGGAVADGAAVKVGAAQTSTPISKAAVTSTDGNFAADSPEALAFNLARDVNAGSATHGVRATRQGGVVSFASTADAVLINLVALSANDIALSADGGASITKALDKIPAAPTGTNNDKSKISVAVGASVDFRTSRQFEQSVNGNSSISARIVAVPAPVQFLDQIKRYLERNPPVTPPTPTPTPTPTT